MVHTRDLGYFVAAAEHGHFTRAAGSLFVTQPALSKQIASLERALGCELFVRHHEGVALTPAGEALLPFARQILALEDEARQATHRAGVAAGAKLTIGFWVAPSDAVLRAAIDSYTVKYPEARLRLRRADWTEVGAGVASGRADVALVQSPHDRPVPGLRSHRLAVEEAVLAVPVGHALADRACIGAEDLAGETVLALPPEAGVLAGGPFARPPRGITPEHVTTIDETIEGVAMGLGVSALTRSVLAAHPHPGIRLVPLSEPHYGDYCIVWREQDEHRPAVQDLVRSFVSAFNTWFDTDCRPPFPQLAPAAPNASLPEAKALTLGQSTGTAPTGAASNA